MIVFIEDQEEAADLYLDELRARGLAVSYFTNVAEAWEYISAAEQAPELVILDIMMPHGKLFSPIATSDGLTTGLHLYKLIRSHFETTYVLALTNLSSPVVDETLRGDDCAFVRRKDEVYYDEVADEVEALLQSSETGSGSSQQAQERGNEPSQ